MSWVKGKFFGGDEKRAAKKQVESTQEAQRLLSANIDRARDEVRPLFEGAASTLSGGFDRARGILQDVAPQQAQLFQSGNLQAQNTLLAGLPQQQNAILGNAAVDLSGLQAQSVNLAGTGLAPPQAAAPQQSLTGGLAQEAPLTTIDTNIQVGGQTQQVGSGSILQQIQAGTLDITQLTSEQQQQMRQEIADGITTAQGAELR